MNVDENVEFVTGAKVTGPYELRVDFSDGTSRDIDLEPELHGEMFEPLKNPGYFAQVTVDEELGKVIWPNGADFSPEFLYYRARARTTA